MTKEEKVKALVDKVQARQKLMDTAQEDGAEIVTYTSKLQRTGLLPYLPAQIVELLHQNVTAYYTYTPGPAHENGLVTDGKCTYIPDGHGGRVYAIGMSTDVFQRGIKAQLVMLCHELAHVETGKGNHDDVFDQYFQMLLNAVNEYNNFDLVRDLIDP